MKKANREIKAGEIMDYVEFLEGTLIPDLNEVGRTSTAEDFETCCVWLREYAELLKGG